MPQTTIPIAASADDQRMEANEFSYPVPGPAGRNLTLLDANASRSYNGSGIWYVGVLLFAFDTSALSGKTITEASLVAKLNNKNDTDGLNITLGYYDWTGSSASDWTGTPETDAHAGTSIASLTTGVDKAFSLLDPNTRINKTGTTKLRMHVSQRAGNAAPTGFNQVFWWQFDDATEPAPRLVVDYFDGSRTRISPDAITTQTTFDPSVTLTTVQTDPDS